MFATVDKIPTEHQIPETQKQNLRKAFTSLKSHAAAVANFTLRWQDLEDHFLVIHNAIQSNLRQLQSAVVESQQTTLSQIPNTNTETAEIPLRSGKDLLRFLISRPRESIRDVICNSLQENTNSGEIVIQAMKFFYDYAELGCGSGAVRKSCVYLLEEFVRAECEVGEELREQARKIAVHWNGKLRIGVQFSLETAAFFMLLIAFGLSNEFEADELLEYFDSVIHRSDVAELFREVRLGDKVIDFVHKLIAQNKRVEAVRFICAFELVDEFPVVPLLKAHLDYVQKMARKMCTRETKSHKAALKAINLEKSALRAIRRITEEYNLASPFPTDFIEQCLKHLTRQKKKINGLIEGDPSSKDQPQREIGKKWNVAAPEAQPSNKGKNKRPRTALPAVAAADGNNADVATSSHQHADLYTHQGLQYLTSSARMPSTRPASQYAFGANSSSIYSMQRQSPPSLTSQYAYAADSSSIYSKQQQSSPPLVSPYAYGADSSSVYSMQRQSSPLPASRYAYGARSSSIYSMQRQFSPPHPSQYAYGANSSSSYSMQRQSDYRSAGLFTTPVEHFRPRAGGVPVSATSPHYLTQRSQYDQETPYVGNGTHQLTSGRAHYSLASSSGDAL